MHPLPARRRHRRHVIATTLAIALLAASAGPASAAVTHIGVAPPAPQAAAPAAKAAAGPGTNYAHDDPFTARRTDWWRQARFGMFIHFGDYSYWGGDYQRADGTICKGTEWIYSQCRIPMAEYEAGARKFNPAKFSAAEIVGAAKAGGQKYIVITSKHHDGYAMWPTKVNTWNLRDHSSFDKQRDILAELKAEADKEGIKLGFYYSIVDWHNKNFTDDFPQYKKDMNAQLKELVTNYHPALLWFDGQGLGTPDKPGSPYTTQDGEDLANYLHTLDRTLLINDRVGKKRIVDGDYHTPEQTIPAAPIAGLPWETCMTMNKSWGWVRRDTSWKPPVTLTRNLIDIVSRGGDYLLNIGPTDTGEVQSQAIAGLREMGAWLGAHGQAVYGADHTGLVATPAWGAVSRSRDNKLYLSVYNWPGAGKELALTTNEPFTVAAARVLGSSQKPTWKTTGNQLAITVPGEPTNQVATVIELTIKTARPARGTGTGLTAEFWDNPTFTGPPAVTRIDRTVNYSWRHRGSPAASIPADNFSSRWTGFVQPEYTGAYTFQTVSDETVKVWVDGKVVIDNSKPHGYKVDQGVISLEAGKKYAIRVDHSERANESFLKLQWRSPNLSQRVIPTRQLYPASGAKSRARTNNGPG